MKWENATDNQLWTIVNHDLDCPRSLWSGAVLEMVNRNLFDYLIADAIHHCMNVQVVDELYKMSADDFMQIGRLEIFKNFHRFNPNKGRKLTTFLYLIVKHELIRQMTALGAVKRDARNNISIQRKTAEGTQYEVFLPDKKIDVERYVVNKVTLEQLLKRVNKHQRTVLYYRLQGYTFEEISQLLGRGNVKSMHQAYTLAIKKMKKGA